MQVSKGNFKYDKAASLDIHYYNSTEVQKNGT